MVAVPVLALVAMTAAFQVANIFFCDATAAAETGDLFEAVSAFTAGTGCDGLPSWTYYLFFIVFTLPWLILLAVLLFSNPVTGTITGLVGLVAGLVAWFTGLFD